MSEPNLTAYARWIAAAVLAGAAFFWAGSRKRLGRAALWTVLLAIPLGLIGARMLYVGVRIRWFLEIGMENALWPAGEEHFYWGDAQGFGLWGAAAGVALAALIAGKSTGRKAGEILDALAPAAALTIALCRFGEFLIGEGVGSYVENEALAFFPVAVSDEWSDRYAVFMLEGLVALIILALVCTYGKRYTCGNRARFFLILYSSAQVLLESLRKDNYLSWQFLRVSQLIAVLVLAGMMAAAELRRGKAEGAGLRRGRIIPVCWGLFLAAVGCCVWLEFAIDKSATVSVELAHALELICCVALGVTSSKVILPAAAEGKNRA